MSRLEGLFGAASEAPRAADRRTRALVLLGVALAAFGIVASSVPGVLVTLAAWWSAERDRDRVESGWLPTSARPPRRCRAHLRSHRTWTRRRADDGPSLDLGPGGLRPALARLAPPNRRLAHGQGASGNAGSVWY